MPWPTTKRAACAFTKPRRGRQLTGSAAFDGRSVKQGVWNRALLEEVIRHKKVFFNAGYAHYDDCLNGNLRLVPDHDQLANLESDYNAMRIGGIVGSEAPTFEALIEQLRTLETRVNDLPSGS